MVEAYLRQSPLAHLHLSARAVNDAASSDAGVAIREITHRVQIVLRGAASDKAFMAAATKALPVELPLDPCTSSGEVEGLHILWMGPDEWLIVAPDDGYGDLASKLSGGFVGVHAAVVDVSESRTTVRLSGNSACETLSKGCSIDLHPRQFSKDKVVNTLLAQAHVTLHQITDDDTNGCTYDIFVHRSFAEYLWSWLEDATREYGLRVLSE